MLLDLEDKTLKELQKLYLYKLNVILPLLAQENNWVVYLNHCFGRICLDNLFKDCWYKYLNRQSKLAAYKQLSKDQLIKIILMCLDIEKKGNNYLIELNNNSLYWRSK